MKKLLVLAITLTVACSMKAQTITPNLGLTLPPQSAINWGVIINQDLTLIDNFAGTVGTNTAINNLLKSLPNCSTPTYVYSPSANGCIVGGGGSYTLPIATTSILGGFKPDGTTITVNSTTGVASATGTGAAFPSTNGLVKNTSATTSVTAVGDTDYTLPSTTAAISTVANNAQSTANAVKASVLTLPSVSTMLFDYQMADGNTAGFTDSSTGDGSTSGVGNCTFIASHVPTYLAGGGAQFGGTGTGGTEPANSTGCAIPAGANSLRTIIAMIQPGDLQFTTIHPDYPTILGSNGSNNGPYIDLKPVATVLTSFGYGMGALASGSYTSGTLDTTSGQACAGYTIGTSGDSTFDVLYPNGQPAGSIVSGPTYRTGVNTSGAWVLGSSGLAQAYYFGKMYRAIGYSSVLSPGQVAAACQILRSDAANKGAVNPATAPNSTTTPQLFSQGDSIAAGTGGGTPPATLITGLPITPAISVYAIPGTIINESAGQINTREVAACTTAAPNYIIMEAGTNDLANGTTPAQAWAYAVRYAQIVRTGWLAKGCKGYIGIQTLISRYTIDTGNAGFVPYNSGTTQPITSGGTGYTNSNTFFTWSGGGCTTEPTTQGGSGGQFVQTSGVITFVGITTPGAGCTSAPSWTATGGTGASGTGTLSVSGNSYRATYNALVVANALSSGYDFIVREDLNPNLGPNFAFLNASYIGNDYIHPTLLGEQAIGADYSAALIKLLAKTTSCYSSASPAVCGASPAGAVSIAAGTTSIVVNTSAVTSASIIVPSFDSSLGSKLGVTCNTTVAQPFVTARTAGSNFTLSITAAPSTNPVCLSYLLTN